MAESGGCWYTADHRRYARVDDRVAAGNAVSEGIFAGHQTQNGSGFNTLTHGRLSDIGAATTMNDNRVDVRPLQRV